MRFKFLLNVAYQRHAETDVEKEEGRRNLSFPDEAVPEKAEAALEDGLLKGQRTKGKTYVQG